MAQNPAIWHTKWFIIANGGLFAADLQTWLNSLPSLVPTVTISYPSSIAGMAGCVVVVREL